MKIPRDLSGKDLVVILKRAGYVIARQTGSHVRMMNPGPPQHKISIPLHKSLKIGTTNAVLKAVSSHLKISIKDLIG